MVHRRLIAAALVVLACSLAATGSATRSGQLTAAAGPLDFDSLPVAPPGALPGRIVYLSLGDCRLREHNLGTGTDQLVRTGACPSVPSVSPAGRGR
jgi:hypothetical protein